MIFCCFKKTKICQIKWKRKKGTHQMIEAKNNKINNNEEKYCMFQKDNKKT